MTARRKRDLIVVALWFVAIAGFYGLEASGAGGLWLYIPMAAAVLIAFAIESRRLLRRWRIRHAWRDLMAQRQK